MPLPCWRPNLDSLHGYAPRADAVRAACPWSHLLPSFLTSVFARAHLRRAISDVYSYLKDSLMETPTTCSISASGLYTAPSSVPANPVVTITAQTSSASGTAMVTIKT
jgi:hypothetical protein